MRSVLLSSSVIALGYLLGPALADQRVEVSPDGRQTVVLPPATGKAGVVTVTDRGVPYGSTPDWQSALRRQVSSLALADVNGDGWLDLVVGCYQSQSYPPYNDWENLIYYNVGGRLEDNPSWVSADEVHTGAVAVGDFNHDGYPDVFSANGGFAMSPSVIYFGAPGGPSRNPGWTSAVPGRTWSTGLALCDVDHDGYLDVVTTNEGNSSQDPFRPIYLFHNNAGAVEPVPSWQSAELSIQDSCAFGDFDNDGWEDLAVTKWDNGFQTGVYKNYSGTLGTTPVWTTGYSDTDKGIAWADVDHNGWQDLAVGHDPTLLYSNAAGTFTQTWSSQATYFGQQDLKFCDVDGDGWAALAEVNFANGQTHIYMNRAGTLDRAPTWTYDSENVGTALAFGDINGDGRPDLVIGYSGQPSIVVFYAQPPAVNTGDLNCDGAVNFYDINPFVLALSDPAGYAQAYPNCSILNGDCNQDGRVDFLDINPFVALLTPP